MEVPEHLTARVVMPGDEPLLHGYDLQSDVSAHYGFGALVYLSLSGELPSDEVARAFDVLLVFAAPVSIAEAPSHAAALARLCSAKPSSVAAVAAIGLAEQARHRVEQLASVLSWLESGRDGKAPLDQHEPATERLHARLRSCGVAVDPRDGQLPLHAAIIAALFDLGLREPWQLEATFATARWPVAQAEAMSNRPGALGTYPIRLPRFDITRDGS